MNHLLIVDANEDSRLQLEALLESGGFTVDSARNGAEALEKARCQVPALVISELLLPTMDGFTLLRHWKAEVRLQQVPFVFYTGAFSGPEDEQLALALGAAAVICKPAAAVDLLAQLRSVWEPASDTASPSPEKSGGDAAELAQDSSALLLRKLEEKVLQLAQQNEELRQELVAREQAGQERERLFDMSLDLLCVADFDGRLQQVNPAWTKCLGWSAEELTSRPMLDFILPEDHESTVQVRKKIYLGTALRGVENRYRCKDGSFRWLSWNVHPLLETRQVFSVARDITERRQTEGALRESEAKFSKLFQSSPIGMTLTTAEEGRYLDANKEFLRILERSREDVVGHTSTELGVWTADERAKMIARFKAEGNLRNIELEVRGSSGQVTQILWSAEAVIFDGVSCLLGSSLDITERKRASERIAAQAQLINQARDSITVCDLNYRLVFWSKGAERLYGWTADEAIGREIQQLLGPDPVDFEEAAEIVLRDGVWTGEIKKVTKAGERVTLVSRWTLLRAADGQPEGILSIGTDVTEQKKLEEQFLRSQRMESIGTLAGGIAHDLNNVLTPIMMAVQVLKLKGADRETLEMLNMLETNSQRGAELVQQVLSFARGVEGRRIMVNPLLLLEELIKIIRETFPKSINVEFHPANDLRMMTGDPTQIHQVFLNLCVNARDAMPEGGKLIIRLKNVEVHESSSAMDPDVSAGSYVLAQIEDTGTGIRPEVRERIFEPFFTTKGLGQGTGLGLSTTQAIVKSHGGFITVDSEPGRGSRFKVFFPAQLEAATAPEPETVDGRLPRGKGETVLVVDDEAPIRKIVNVMLTRFGYRVLLAENGEEAAQIYAQQGSEIDVVLTDMAMPVMDGPALIKALQAMNPRVRVIGSSGLSSYGAVARAIGEALPHFISKPYTTETLLKTLREVLAEQPAGRPQ
jgi:PAS domain S-box-containing protein